MHTRQILPNVLTSFAILAVVMLSACGSSNTSPEVIATLTSPNATNSPVPSATATPLPATATLVPPTSTSTPTDTVTPLPSGTPTPSETPTETSLPPTASGEDAIYVFYIQKENGGPLSCGDTLVKLNTGAYRSGDNEADIATALRWLFNKQEYIGNLYNPVFRSNWKIMSVDFKAYDGLADVSLEGGYVRSGDRCDDSRVRAQIWSTIRQFPGVKSVYILMNGNLLGDILATGK